MSHIAAADRKLADQFGVSGELIRSLRRDHLTKGTHYQTRRREAGREWDEVTYTEAGTVAMTELLLSRSMQLEVVKLFPNPTWVGVLVPGDSEILQVRVRSSKRLRRGSRIQCAVAPGSVRCTDPEFAPRDA